MHNETAEYINIYLLSTDVKANRRVDDLIKRI